MSLITQGLTTLQNACLKRSTNYLSKVKSHVGNLVKVSSRPNCVFVRNLYGSNTRGQNIFSTQQFSLPVDIYQTPSFIASRGIKEGPPETTDPEENISRLFVPVHYEKSQFDEDMGEEIAGPLEKDEILKILNKFYTDEDVQQLAREQGLDRYLFQQTIIKFRKFCIESDSLPTDLHIVISDIVKGAGHIHNIYPYFFKHAKNIFPHLNCMDDLYKISDLSKPPNWYPEARAINRKIIFHAGPTNSGKTYHAMEQFLAADSGVYCGPLKLLAVEVNQKSNAHGTPCDLVTGEERKYAISEDHPANHVACTIEMVSVTTPYDVAVIDEIQMLKDPQRGWAWTRAVLGICAKEIHVCGEGAAIDVIRQLALNMGEDVEVRRYKRLTSLTIEETAMISPDFVQPGDCIVCFSKQHIHQVAQRIEKWGKEVAVIYGGLPPGAKLAQAQKFNDPNHSCKIMVATDAIGMGINLSIRRIIFYSLIKPNINEKGEKEMDTISVSQALQIAGRAGRYGTQFSEGFVTTMKASEIDKLRELLSSTPSDVEQAGIHPTAEQIELFAFHLPSYTLSNLVDIFINLCTVDSSLYYMCRMDDFKFLADLIQHTPLQLRARYIMCCAPINKKMPLVCAMFLKFVRQYSQNEVATLDWVCHHVKWPFNAPKTIFDLVHLEAVFDVFDLYLWLSYRFPEMFPDADMLRELQAELDIIIQMGVTEITRLLNNATDPSLSDGQDAYGEGFFGHKGSIKSKNKKRLPGNTRISVKQIMNQLKQSPGTKLKLTDQLIQQGLISPQMLERLKEEWMADEAQNSHHFKIPRNKKK